MFCDKVKKEFEISDKFPGFIPPPPPSNKVFETMFELLRDAEKYDNAGEKGVSNATLNNLCDFIDDYINNQNLNISKK